MTGEGSRFLDTLGFWDAVAAQPEQLHAVLDARPVLLTSAADLGAVHLVGVGASGTACDAASAYLRAEGRLPVSCGPGPELPALVGPQTLVVAVGAAGEGVEVLDAARTALDRGALVLTVVGQEHPGALIELAVAEGLLCVPVPGAGGPLARAAVGSTLATVLRALSSLGLGPDATASLRAAATALPGRRDALLAPGGPADQLARRIGRTIPLIYGADGLPAVAARHWKSACNENVKTPAFSSAISDAAYGEVSGWGQHGDVTRQVLTLLALRHRGESPLMARRFSLVLEATDEVMAGVESVWAEGEDDLGRFFDLCLFGDACSLFLAGQEGIDPGPVAIRP